MRAERGAEQITVFAYVGNLGCIRFPPEVRSAAGVKRGDRLALSVTGQQDILLEKLPVGLTTRELEIQGCACQATPEACRRGLSDVLTVGWSYVQLDHATATELGFLPGRPLRMIAERSQIRVSIHYNRRDLAGITKVTCPP